MDPTTPQNPAEAAPSTAPNPEKAAAARELVSGMLEHMGVKAELEVQDKPDGIHIAMKPSAGADVLGQARRGGVLESMAYLVNKAINREEQGRKWVFLDLAGAPQTAGAAEPAAAPSGEIDPASKAAAEELLAKVKKLGGVAWMGPVPAKLRGLHAALAAGGARVKAEGEGIHRRLVIEAH